MQCSHAFILILQYSYNKVRTALNVVYVDGWSFKQIYVRHYMGQGKE